MRTKFKAWHKEEKVMCEVSIINFESGAFLLGLKPSKDQIQDRCIVYAPTNGRFCEWEEIEILEFTGRKDKNGVEIYESDIVEITAEGSYSLSIDDIEPTTIDRIYIGEVVILPSKGVCLRKPKYEDRIDGENKKIDYYYGVVSYRSKVIGNIFKNPELLTVSK